MMCPSCGQGKMRSHLHVCAECGEEFIGPVAAKHLDRIAKEFNQIRLDHLRNVEAERDAIRDAVAKGIDDAAWEITRDLGYSYHTQLKADWARQRPEAYTKIEKMTQERIVLILKHHLGVK